MSRVFKGDNLKILKKLKSESVDLAYADPPYYTNDDWSLVDNDGVTHTFSDKFDNIDKYIEFIKLRLVQVHRVLKPTGSVYIQCDDNAIAHLIILMNSIFGIRNKRNIITWRKCNPKNNATRSYGDVTDYILFYTKSNKYTFNVPKSDIITEGILKEYKFDSKKGMYYIYSTLTAPKSDNVNTNYDWINPDDGVTVTKVPKNRSWRTGKEGMMELHNEGRLRYKNGKLMTGRGKINYRDVLPTRTVNNFWDDINFVNGNCKERLDYPTQKPILLLIRIIKVSSNPKEVVLDFFGGSGTTAEASLKLGRKYIIIDISESACNMMIKRLKKASKNTSMKL